MDAVLYRYQGGIASDGSKLFAQRVLQSITLSRSTRASSAIESAVCDGGRQPTRNECAARRGEVGRT